MRNSKEIKKQLTEWLLSGMLLLCTVSLAEAVRIKDIADVAGVRGNSLVGYGLVVGLAGTGDKAGTLFTVQSLASMLTRMGVTIDPNKVKVKNVAAVMVTAKLPPFAKPGSRLDVTLSSLGDASTLQGGTLLLTPLKGPDQVVYVVAQGEVSVGGFIGGDQDKTQKNHPTVGRVPTGGVVEREVPVVFDDKGSISFMLRDPDFTTAIRLADVINAQMRTISPESETVGFPPPAHASDSASINVAVPEVYKGRIVEFLSRLESLDVQIDFPARIVVNERTGTIVMGANVRILDVAIAHGNLTIQVKSTPQVSQPAAFSGGITVETKKETTTVTEEPAKVLLFQSGPTIGTLVAALKAIGVTPRDLISILQAIKVAGALEAQLEII
ncbi:MAG: flagellar basal body P-ring protein FlgI [Nitrospirae bacterium]|nr:flagellar basal body P-ring protein FlgI [Candidatus Troglogloeales bacterium]